MKILFLFLLVVGPWCVRGQGVLPAPGGLQGAGFLPGPEFRLGPGFQPGPGDGVMLPGGVVGDSALERRLFVSGGAEVRVMQPDRMSCVVANLALVERMPVDRRGSGDRMPVYRGSEDRVLEDRIPGRVKGLLAPR